MRTLDPAIAARRAARSAIHTEVMVWLEPRNRETDANEGVGFWTGPDHLPFSIAGVQRTYYGAGNTLQVPPIEAATGILVQTYDVGLSAIAPEAELILRGYDTFGAKAEIHVAEFDDNGNLLAEPQREFKGWVDGQPILTPAIGGDASATVRLVSNARILTFYGTGTKSDQMQRRRQNDAFRQYGSAEGIPNWGGLTRHVSGLKTFIGRIANR